MKYMNELQTLRDVKTGNKEMAVFYDHEGNVEIHLGNSSPCVMLGEVTGDIVVESHNIESAVDAMWVKLRKFQS